MQLRCRLKTAISVTVLVRTVLKMGNLPENKLQCCLNSANFEIFSVVDCCSEVGDVVVADSE